MAQWILIMWAYTFVFKDIPMTTACFLMLATAATLLSVTLVYIKTSFFGREKGAKSL